MITSVRHLLLGALLVLGLSQTIPHAHTQSAKRANVTNNERASTTR